MFELIRCVESDGGVFGALVGDGFHCDTMEREWRGNAPNVSCIPAGRYICHRDRLGRHRYARVADVPDRELIEFHPANYPDELMGCVALGETTGRENGRLRLYESAPAVDRFMKRLGGDEKFVLHVRFANGEKNERG